MNRPFSSRRVAPLVTLLASSWLVASGCIFAIDSDHDDGDGVHFSRTCRSETAHCPVDGDKVATDHSPSSTYKGDVYYFCCNTCKAHFERDPEKYLGAQAPPADAKAEIAK